MQFTVERAPLLRALNHLQNVIQRGSTIPILQNLVMRADSRKLEMIGTDMMVEIVEDVSLATMISPGETTVPAKVLHDIVKKYKDGAQIEMEMTEANLVIRSGRSRFTLATMPCEDYPVMSAGDMRCVFNICAADLRRLFGRIQFAMSKEEVRYYLNGIYLHATQEGAPHLCAVATDGHRLAKVQISLPEGSEEAWRGQGGVIIPRKTVIEIDKLIDGFDGDVSLSISDTKIRLMMPGIVLTSKLIDGTFPDYDRVIPAGNNKILDVDRANLTAAVDRVATIDDSRSRAVCLGLDGNTLTLSARNQEMGSATEEVDALWEAPPMDIGFNSRYLQDIAEQIGGVSMRFTLADPGSPALISDIEDPSALYVLMPMRV